MTSLGTAGSLPLSTHPQKATTREGGVDADGHEMQMQMHEIAKRKGLQEEPRAKEKNETATEKRKGAKAEGRSSTTQRRGGGIRRPTDFVRWIIGSPGY